MSRTASLLGLLFLPFVAIGHHSTAEYDRSVVLEFEAEVVRVLWRNPHVRLTVQTQRDDGTEELWDLEAGDVNSMDRRGIRRDLVHIGDAVKIGRLVHAAAVATHGLVAVIVRHDEQDIGCNP